MSGHADWTSNVQDVVWLSEISWECDVLAMFTWSKPLQISVNHKEILKKMTRTTSVFNMIYVFCEIFTIIEPLIKKIKHHNK